MSADMFVVKLVIWNPQLGIVRYRSVRYSSGGSNSVIIVIPV